MFLSSQYFGRCGRALLRAFSRRQRELIRRGLNPQLVTVINFWIANMKCLRPGQIPFSMKDVPKLVSYSDGEGDKAGVGIAVWFLCGRFIGGYIQLPPEVRGVWSRASTVGSDYDIFEIEAVGPALILWNWLKLFPPSCLWIHFIDNDSAPASLVKGSSAVLSGECITAFTHSRIASAGLWAWFDRVASKDNPVDQLSRGKLEGEWELLDISFPAPLLEDLRRYLREVLADDLLPPILYVFTTSTRLRALCSGSTSCWCFDSPSQVFLSSFLLFIIC